ncbi:hypothetical protein CC86DRAFT_453749 [Ophiobolus disseminans]|uniref:DUF6604 domain-containing protein n=1 Tax=Ophiobolus disseminans TaxID=1469910 RepID=A0A6A7A6T1_9PLEO|nr:hypothetical protein CC86DRAFT_453749 [Ophiobolus disseminans]
MGRYAWIKSQTNIAISWLVETARANGGYVRLAHDPNVQHSSTVVRDVPKQSRLKSKASKNAKNAEDAASQLAPDDETGTSYKVSMEELLRLAAFLKDLGETFIMPKRTWRGFKEASQGSSTVEEGHDMHENIAAIPSPSPESVPVARYEPNIAKMAEDQLVLQCFLNDIDEVRNYITDLWKRLFEKASDAPSLQSAAFITQMAFEHILMLEEPVRERIGDDSGLIGRLLQFNPEWKHTFRTIDGIMNARLPYPISVSVTTEQYGSDNDTIIPDDIARDAFFVQHATDHVIESQCRWMHPCHQLFTGGEYVQNYTKDLMDGSMDSISSLIARAAFLDDNPVVTSVIAADVLQNILWENRNQIDKPLLELHQLTNEISKSLGNLQGYQDVSEPAKSLLHYDITPAHSPGFTAIYGGGWNYRSLTRHECVKCAKLFPTMPATSTHAKKIRMRAASYDSELQPMCHLYNALRQFGYLNHTWKVLDDLIDMHMPEIFGLERPKTDAGVILNRAILSLGLQPAYLQRRTRRAAIMPRQRKRDDRQGDLLMPHIMLLVAGDTYDVTSPRRALQQIEKHMAAHAARDPTSTKRTSQDKIVKNFTEELGPIAYLKEVEKHMQHLDRYLETDYVELSHIAQTLFKKMNSDVLQASYEILGIDEGKQCSKWHMVIMLMGLREGVLAAPRLATQAAAVLEEYILAGANDIPT